MILLLFYPAADSITVTSRTFYTANLWSLWVSSNIIA